jgi:hypothetical protein
MCPDANVFDLWLDVPVDVLYMFCMRIPRIEDSGWKCDVCDEGFPLEVASYHCAECKYDECSSCVSRRSSAPGNAHKHPLVANTSRGMSVSPSQFNALLHC